MERRQPYTEIPYRPADTDSGARPYYGIAGVPISRSHPIARVIDDEEEAAAVAIAESERIRALIDAERERTFAESARRRSDAEAAARATAEGREHAETLAAARAAAEARAEAAELAAERNAQAAFEAKQILADSARQRTLASEDRLSVEAESLHNTAERNREDRERAEQDRNERDRLEHDRVHEAEPVWYKGASMSKRIITAVIVIVFVVIGYFWWKQHKAASDIANGEIFSDDLTPGSRTHSGQVTPTIAKPTSSAPVQTITGSDGSTTIIPPTDSQSPNAPNGARFTGTGKYQVYRQGNLTWRINTETGESCILFATEEEWRKSIVFNHGCNAS